MKKKNETNPPLDFVPNRPLIVDESINYYTFEEFKKFKETVNDTKAKIAINPSAINLKTIIQILLHFQLQNQ